jgi:hypothetical protein
MSTTAQGWVIKNCKFASEFDYVELAKDLWRDVIKGGKDVFDISFDTENDEAVAKPFDVDVDGNRFVCEPHFAGGDRDDPVLYYRCQLKENNPEYRVVSFGEDIDTFWNSFFIFIPGKDDGNPNLTGSTTGGKPCPSNASHDYPRPSERKGRAALRKWLKDCCRKRDRLGQ